jgi:hypothetical protein
MNGEQQKYNGPALLSPHRLRDATKREQRASGMYRPLSGSRSGVAENAFTP